MKIIPYTEKVRPMVEDAIKKFGHAPEHNVDLFENDAEDEQKPYFVTFPSGNAIFAYHEDDVWYTLSDPISPRDKMASLINEFARSVLKDESIEKIVVEYDTETRKQLKELLAPEYKMRPINYTLVWPVTTMSNFDPVLPGKKWKSIRNARNKFYREHDVKIVGINDVPKEDLHGLVDRWGQERGGGENSRGDRAYAEPYHNIINSGFAGCTEGRVMIVDGVVVGFNAGWMIPNTETYYGALGLHDYSLSDLGQVLYLEDLEWLKKKGYKKVNMAGGEKELSGFKNQFHPDYWYKTHVFAIARV